METIKSSNQLEKKLEQFDENQKIKILKNTFAIQLTEGCSTGCKDCGLGAEKGVTDYIPFEFLKTILSNKNFKKSKKYNLPIFYFASEPFDYDFDGKNYLDVHKLYQDKKTHNPDVVTSIPKGQEERIFNILAKNIDKQTQRNELVVKCISLTKFNYKRIKKIFNELVYVKNQTKNNSNKYVLKFPNGIELENENEIDFEDFLNSINKESHVNVRNFYSNETGRYKIGEENKNDLEKYWLSNYKGIILTPKGVYNIRPTKLTFDNPIGQLITPVDPDNFSVNKLSIPYFIR